ncbi:hypothetical protein [Stenotrophomonas tumulicola]|uniref:AraC family transcriptional regulator n=1 Tax=Stenotrophomonas tumulicola TaxID=1685415 RepID=A0A7W3FJ53_9GAMM|nr:hypothetical protein [Stenotrophomonas tumulicola]MBA8680514.1 hypothetical protein [Stenotrophomonas tumulicola]
MTSLVSQPSLSDILRLQELCEQMPQAEMPVEHVFLPGQYLRKMSMPAHSLVVGKRHRYRHALIVTGHVTVRTADGMHELQGTHIIDSPAGMKRAIYAHSPSELVTVHLTDETDLDRIEALVIMPDDEPLALENQP